MNAYPYVNFIYFKYNSNDIININATELYNITEADIIKKLPNSLNCEPCHKNSQEINSHVNIYGKTCRDCHGKVMSQIHKNL
jgi:cytochrome c5